MSAGVLVLGAGSWGTALAVACARNGFPVTLWGHDASQMALLEQQRENHRYLPDVHFPDQLQITSDLRSALLHHSDVLVVVPSRAFRDVCQQLCDHKTALNSVAWGTKGFDPDSGGFLSEVARQILGPKISLAVISGPSFAAEISRGLPAAMSCAGSTPEVAELWAAYLRSPTLRAYTNQDLIGTQLGGAMKNVMAIAAGAVEGMQLGANALAAMITRGLAEMMRLGVHCGAEAHTLMGLAGMGDLVLSCTDNQSRNRRYGFLRAQGKNHAEALATIGHVVEGTFAAQHALALAQKHKIELPITEMVCRFVEEKISAEDALKALFGRDPKAE